MRRFNPQWLNRPRKRDNPEGRLVRQILIYLHARGYAAGKLKTMGVKRGNAYCFDPYQWRGVPDLLVFTPALVFIECKSPTGTQSSEQKIFQEYCNTANLTYILARNLSDVEKALP